MRNLSVLLLSIACLAGCGVIPKPSMAGIAAGLPQSVGGQPVKYVEQPASAMGDQAIFFDDPIKAVGGTPETARVAIGQGRDGFFLTALRVPGVDATRLVDPMIKGGSFNPTGSSLAVMGGKDATVLTLPPQTLDRAYLYAFGDTVVIITTSQPALADEALRALP